MSEVRFLIVKETVGVRFCSRCHGTGKVEERVVGRKIMENCPICRGTGKEKITHRTEISLQEAIEILYPQKK